VTCLTKLKLKCVGTLLGENVRTLLWAVLFSQDLMLRLPRSSKDEESIQILTRHLRDASVKVLYCNYIMCALDMFIELSMFEDIDALLILIVVLSSR